MTTTIRELATDRRELRVLVASGEARALRLRAHVTLAEAGAAIGRGPSTIWRWEAGQRFPRGADACAYLGLLRDLAG